MGAKLAGRSRRYPQVAVSRIVYFSLPACGHVNPTLPVVAELVRRGVEVHYFATEQFQWAVEAAGAVFVPYTVEFRMPARGQGPFRFADTTVETLLEMSEAVLRAHLLQVRAMAPTIVMHDSFSPWGGLVARCLRLPTVASVPSIAVNQEIATRYGPGPDAAPPEPGLTPEWLVRVKARCAAFSERYGLPPPRSPAELLQTYGDLNVVYTSRWFQPLEGSFPSDRFKFVGACLQARPDAAPFPFERLDGRPLVYVSMGSVYEDLAHVFRTCLEALAEGHWQVVMATGWNFPEGWPAPVPDNFLVQPFVPQLEILRRAAVFVTHAGMNGTHEALYNGVPLVALPQGSDQFWIAHRAAELGVGLVLEGGAVTARCLRESVERILDDPAYAAAAARVGESLRVAGGPARAAGEIAAFLTTAGRESVPA